MNGNFGNLAFIKKQRYAEIISTNMRLIMYDLLKTFISI